MPLAYLQKLGEVGIAPDAAPWELPEGAWSDGINVRFRDGYAERVRGKYSPFNSATVAPYYMLPIKAAGGGDQIVYFGLSKIYAVSGTTHTNITRQTASVDVDYTGGSGDRWAGGVLSGVMVATNGIDMPQFWGGSLSAKMADLADWPSTARCKVIRPFKNFLIALGVTKSGTEYPYMVKWSDAADPGTLPDWDETDPTKSAGEADIAETPDYIVDGMAFQDQFLIFKERSVYAMTPTGDIRVFAFRKVSDTVGALAKNCIAPFPGGLAVLSEGDAHVWDGAKFTSILDGKARKWLARNIDSTGYVMAWAETNLKYSEVWFGIPTTGASVPNVALVWSYRDGSLSFREIGNASAATQAAVSASSSGTWADETGPWTEAVGPWSELSASLAEKEFFLADTSKEIYLTDATFDLSVSNTASRIERTGMDFGEPDRRKMIRGIRPRIEGTAGSVVNVFVGQEEEIGDGVLWSGPFPFTVGVDLKVDCLVSGRYMALKIESSQAADWRLRSLGVDLVRQGLY